MSVLMMTSSPVLAAHDGGATTLDRSKSQLLQLTAGLIRRLSEDHALRLLGILEEFERDEYLERVRGHEPPVVKIFAEVANGWDESGAYEFARAWVSTLVAREDGFSWENATEPDKREHRRKVFDELARRGVLPPED
jgi:hypothetical protein